MEASDEALMSAYADADRVAFQSLYMRWEERLRAFIRFRVLDTSRRDDVFQLTWLKIHQNRKAFDPQKKFRPWVYTICLNVIRDLIRERKVTVELKDEVDPQKAAVDRLLEAELLQK